MPGYSDDILLNAGAIALTAPVATAAPAISNIPVVNATVNAVASFAGTPTPSSTYQWSRCTTVGCNAITGANAASYLVQSVDVGHSLRVAVTAANPAGAISANSGQSAIVPTPTFTLSSTQSTVTVPRGSTGRFTIAVTDHYGFTGPVAMSESGNPMGATPSFSPASTATSTAFSLKTSARSRGTWAIKLTGTRGGHTASITVTLKAI